MNFCANSAVCFDLFLICYAPSKKVFLVKQESGVSEAVTGRNSAALGKTVFNKTMLCNQKQFLCDSATGLRRHGGHAGRV